MAGEAAAIVVGEAVVEAVAGLAGGDGLGLTPAGAVAVIAVTCQQGIAGGTIVISIFLFAGQAVGAVVEETELLAQGIFLAGEVAEVVVAILPEAHVGVSHACFASQQVIGQAGAVSGGIGDGGEVVVQVVNVAGEGHVIFPIIGNVQHIIAGGNKEAGWLVIETGTIGGGGKGQGLVGVGFVPQPPAPLTMPTPA